MKDLFKSKFPFVEKEDKELTTEQLEMKRFYESTYEFVPKEEDNRLRDIPADEQISTGGARNKSNDSRRTRQ